MSEGVRERKSEWVSKRKSKWVRDRGGEWQKGERGTQYFSILSYMGHLSQIV